MKSFITITLISFLICQEQLWAQSKHDFHLTVAGGFAAGPDVGVTFSLPTGISTSIGVERDIAKHLHISLQTEFFAVTGFELLEVAESRRTFDIQAMTHLQTKPKEGLYLDLGLGVQYKFHRWIISTTDRYSLDFVYDNRRIVVPKSSIALLKESAFGYTIRPGIYKAINKTIDGGLYIQFQNDIYKYTVYSLRLSLRTKL